MTYFTTNNIDLQEPFTMARVLAIVTAIFSLPFLFV